jgi:hypothetical protein
VAVAVWAAVGLAIPTNALHVARSDLIAWYSARLRLRSRVRVAPDRSARIAANELASAAVRSGVKMYVSPAGVVRTPGGRAQRSRERGDALEDRGPGIGRDDVLAHAILLNQSTSQ